MTTGGDGALDGGDSGEVSKWRRQRAGAYRGFVSPVTAVLANDAVSVTLYDQRDGTPFVVRDWQVDTYLAKKIFARTPPASPSVLPFRPVGEDAKAKTVGQPDSRKRRRGSRGKR